jgi:hypothetical protein
MRWVGHVARMVAIINCRKPKRKRIVGRPGSICEDNIKMNLKQAGRVGVDSSASG